MATIALTNGYGTSPWSLNTQTKVAANTPAQTTARTATTATTATVTAAPAPAATTTTKATARTTAKAATTTTSVQQQNQVAQLKSTDQSVRSAVEAQLRAAGAAGGAVVYQYQMGPDGTTYAVTGDVTFNVQPIPNNPQATIAAMQTIENAALLSAQPTASDLLAVREAQQYISQAQAQLKSAQAPAATTTAATPARTAQAANAAKAAKTATTAAVTAATHTVLAAQQAAVGTLYGIPGRSFTAYAAANTQAAPANQTGAQHLTGAA